MPTCKHCEHDHDTDALVRHEHGPLVTVQCPDCSFTMGIWRDPARRDVPVE
jgi:hypothetical protein